MGYNWQTRRYSGGLEYILQLDKVAEGWIVANGDVFEVTLVDLNSQTIVCTAQYKTLAAAKRGLITAAKRFGYIPAECEPEPAPVVADEATQGPTSIWEWDDEILSYATWIEGNGLGIDGVVTQLEDGTFEGDVVVGIHVFRKEYPDEWTAKRGVLTLGRALVEQAVAV